MAAGLFTRRLEPGSHEAWPLRNEITLPALGSWRDPEAKVQRLGCWVT